MKLHEKGVLPESDIYIYNSSLIKKDYFYQLLCIGHYWCTHSYSVKPNTLDSYLLLYVVDGEMYTVTDRGKEVLKAGQLSILNCYERPSYGSQSSVEFFWIHFDSHDIASLYNEMRTRTVTVADRLTVRNCFSKIIDPFIAGGQPGEAITNKYITNLLTEFFESDSSVIDTGVPKTKFEDICNYINSNIERKISNEELAEMANMSMYHFIRAFKKETGFTPHEFILRSRINTAIFLLRATSLTLSEITYRCGFANEAAFSNSFKSFTGLTPLKCRQDAWGKVESRRQLAQMEHIREEDEEE